MKQKVQKKLEAEITDLKPNCKDTVAHVAQVAQKKTSQTQAVRHADQTRQSKYYWKTLTTDNLYKKSQNTALLMVRVNCRFLRGAVR